MKKIVSFFTLICNHLFEFIRFVRFSNMIYLNTPDKLRGKIIFRYHSIEKGLINKPIRHNFGSYKIIKLLDYLHLWVNNNYSLNDTQFLSACKVLETYWDLHVKAGINIEDIISIAEYNFIIKYSKQGIGGTVSLTSEEYFINSKSSFDDFSKSRHSIRHFNGALIETKIIEEVIKLARNAPSVCNRQGFRVKLINNNNLVQQTLKVQSGLNATAKTVRQILIVSIDRGVFVSSSEWYQAFIDGGIFLQNLLYSLHFHMIAAVPLNWSKHFKDDIKLEKILNLPKSEKVIALVAIGYPVDSFKVPVSRRKNINEIFEIINNLK